MKPGLDVLIDLSSVFKTQTISICEYNGQTFNLLVFTFEITHFKYHLEEYIVYRWRILEIRTLTHPVMENICLNKQMMI